MKGTFLAVLMLAATAIAQTSYPPAVPGRQPATTTTSSAPPATASPAAQADLNQALSQLERTSNSLSSTLGQLRIEKWKTGSQEKSQLQANADSLQRNLTTALPGIVQGVRSAPDKLAASFKLYRNVSALYDVLASLTEAAGAFGPKDDFRDLSQELQQIDGVRHVLGDRLEQLATAKDAELVRLTTQAKQAQAPAPPKKIVVDDNAQPKPKKKKKPAGATAQTTPPPQQ